MSRLCHELNLNVRLTPNLVALEGLFSKNLPNKSIGDHIASPYIVSDEELTMIPMKLTTENVMGTESNCGKNAAAGLVAREAKSGALLDRKCE